MNNLKKITRKTLLYKSGVEYADYGLNHVEGCSHGCTYPCYAMMLKKRCGKIESYEDWIQPKIVENSLELLDKELPRLKHKIKQVFLCFATDPFMYGNNDVKALTLDILKRLKSDSIKSILISKGLYPEELADKSLFNSSNEYGSTIVSLSEDFQNKYEPFAATVELRIKALKKLHNAGLKTWVSMEPYPTPNIIKQDIRDMLESVAFVDKIVFGKWNYNGQTSKFIHYKQFYNSMAYEVVKFCDKNKIEVHIKDGTLNTELIPDNRSYEKDLLACYA